VFAVQKLEAVMLVSFPSPGQDTQRNQFKEERLISAQSFRDFRPLSAGLLFWGLW
jgi:hypothetical protein